MKKMFTEIEKQSTNLFKELRQIRRYLHKHPELGRLEYQTSKYIKQKIAETGKFRITMVGPTGFTADLIQSESLPWVAIRADMDALPINDEKDVPYKSVIQNCSHACGHDFHSTVVIGVAKILNQFKSDLNGNVRFIFQHAEEPIPGGALDFVNKNMLDNIDCIFGFHADPTLKTNTLGILPGYNSAQSIHWKIKINGKGGHSSRPQNAIDPIFIGISVLNALYADLYRKLDFEKPFVFTVGKINAGENYNSIPDTFSSEGTLRITDVKNLDDILDFMEQSVEKKSTKWGASAEFSFTAGSPPVINDVEKTNRVTDYIREVVKKKQFVNIKRSMGGEDFGYYQTVVPGVFIKIGVANNKIKHAVHTSKFDIDEKAIPFAVSLMSYILMRYLQDKTNLN